MSGRTVLSRPRTRIYDANYNIGQNYYKPTLDRLDKKYYPRPLSPQRASSIAQDIFNRHEEAFADEDLSTARRRAEKRITENNLFDFRGGRIASQALNSIQNDMDEENTIIQHLRANKKVANTRSVDFDNTIDNISSQRLLERSEKALKSVGLDENFRRTSSEDTTKKRTALKVSYENESGDLVKWSPLQRNEEKESPAAIRAKQTRNRLLDLEDEMAELAEKQAARNRRAARFKALVAETAEQSEALQSSVTTALSVRARQEQRTLVE